MVSRAYRAWRSNDTPHAVILGGLHPRCRDILSAISWEARPAILEFYQS